MKTAWFRFYGQVSPNFKKTVFLFIWANAAKGVKRQSVLINFGQFEQNQRVFFSFGQFGLN